MKRNSYNHFRKKRIKSIDSVGMANEQEINKNKLDKFYKLLKEKSEIEKEISNLSSKILNHSSKKNNNCLNEPQANSIKRESFENKFLVNHLINKNNYLLSHDK